jgi:glycosyltransferase involved in cell wall biosynthesis
MLLVSVIITTYNRRNLLSYAIQSVFEQTYLEFEIIVINDRGDDVSDIVESFHSDKIRLVTHIANSGLAYARNTGIQIANGDILCYLDDDDLFLPNHLDVIANAFNKNLAVNILYVDANYINEELEKEYRNIISVNEKFVGNEYSLERLLISNYIPINSLAHRSSILTKIGLFNESLKLYEDWDMLLRMAIVSDFLHIKQTTVEVRNRLGIADNMLMSSNLSNYNMYRSFYKKYNKNISPKLKMARYGKLCHHLKKQIQNQGSFRKNIPIFILAFGTGIQYVGSVLKYYLSTLVNEKQND